MAVLHGTLLQPRSPGECAVTPGAVVRINSDGRIAEVGVDQTKAADVIGGEGCWILPGFIDAHLHVPQWDRRGIDGLSLAAWQKQVAYPAEMRMKDADLAERLTESFVDSELACGTTTIVAFGSPFPEATNRAFTVFARRGLRAIFGKMLNDTNCPGELSASTEQGLEDSRTLASKWHGQENGRLGYAFCLRTPLCCSEKLMRGASALAEMFNCHVQTNVGESLADITEIREQYPETLDDVELFADMGLLTPRTVLAHGVFLGHEERHRLAESRTVLVHCPTANLFMESGVADFVALRTAGVRLALGSSIASGYEPFMPKVAVVGLQTAKALKAHAIPRSSRPAPKPTEAWWAITRGAAEALNLGDRIGLIEPDYEADCLVVRPEPWVNDLPPDYQISALLYSLSPKHIEHVFVAGKRVGPVV